MNRERWVGIVLSIVMGLGCLNSVVWAQTKAKNEENNKIAKSITQEWIEELRHGELKVEGDRDAVNDLILARNIPIPYNYISILMRTPNAFGQGPACIVCHSSSDPAKSYRGLNLSTCEGIKKGSTEKPVRPIFKIGQPAKESILIRRLRNNRMPFAVSFAAPIDSPAIQKVRDWIRSGAPNDENFKENVLPLFSQRGAFASEMPACTECHMSNQEPPSFHELDLSSYEGIILGADSVAKGVAHATKIVIPGQPDKSPLLQRLTENRMPPGIPPTENRDHPNTLILMRWIEQGAPCN